MKHKFTLNDKKNLYGGELVTPTRFAAEFGDQFPAAN